MNKEAKLYQEYLDWVEKINEPFLKEWKKDWAKYLKRQEKKEKEYKEKLKRWEFEEKFYIDQVELWKTKNWLYKLFNPKPKIPWKYDLYNKPKIPFSITMSGPLYYFPGKVSIEGFYSWLGKVKFKT